MDKKSIMMRKICKGLSNFLNCEMKINRSQNKNITMTRLKTNLLSDLNCKKVDDSIGCKGFGLKTTHDH